LNHLDIALGSQGEVEVQLEIAKRVGFLGSRDYDRIQAMVEQVGRMLNGLITAVQPPTSPG
jgi:four helix bundle protein